MTPPPSASIDRNAIDRNTSAVARTDGASFLSACRSLHLASVQEGISNGRLLARDGHGRGALHYALEGENTPRTFAKKLEIVALLAYFLPKEELNKPDNAGMTPLQQLCELSVDYMEKAQPWELLQTMNLYDKLDYGSLDRTLMEKRMETLGKAAAARPKNTPYPGFGAPQKAIFYGILLKSARKAANGEEKPYFAKWQMLQNAVARYVNASGLGRTPGLGDPVPWLTQARKNRAKSQA